MKIKSLHLRDGLSAGFYEFGNISVVFSNHNKAGKTTLLRCILYALGYPIPSMRNLDFAKMEFTLSIQTDAGEDIQLKRSGAALELSLSRSEEIEIYSLPTDQNALHKILFGIGDETVLDNLLGAFYLDQEKGWTLLNRGKVIGSIHFSIEDFLRGLIGAPCTREREQLAAIKEEIRKCQYMLKVAQYQVELGSSGDVIPAETFAEDITRDIFRLRNARKPWENELRRLREVIRDHEKFRNYIDKMQLRLQIGNNRTIPVKARNLVGFSDMDDFLHAKLANVRERIVQLDRQIAKLQGSQAKNETLVSVETSIQHFAEELSRIKINTPAVERMLEQFQTQRRAIEKNIQQILVRERTAVADLTNSIMSYLREFGINEQFGWDVFTNDLKSFSGTIFHLQVFAFTMSYAKLVRARTGCVLPLIIDSPHGREVEADTVKKMMEVLLRDFSDHQIIIATIYNPELPSQKTIELADGIMHLGAVPTGPALVVEPQVSSSLSNTP